MIKNKNVLKNIKNNLINKRYKFLIKNLFKKICLNFNLLIIKKKNYIEDYSLINKFYSIIHKAINKNIIHKNKGKKKIKKIVNLLKILKNKIYE